MRSCISKVIRRICDALSKEEAKEKELAPIEEVDTKPSTDPKALALWEKGFGMKL